MPQGNKKKNGPSLYRPAHLQGGQKKKTENAAMVGTDDKTAYEMLQQTWIIEYLKM